MVIYMSKRSEKECVSPPRIERTMRLDLNYLKGSAFFRPARPVNTTMYLSWVVKTALFAKLESQKAISRKESMSNV